MQFWNLTSRILDRFGNRVNDIEIYTFVLQSQTQRVITFNDGTIITVYKDRCPLTGETFYRFQTTSHTFVDYDELYNFLCRYIPEFDKPLIPVPCAN